MRPCCALVFIKCFLFLITLCVAEWSVEKKEKLLNSFIDHLNSLPNQPYVYEEGVLLSAQKSDTNCYKLEVNIKVSDIHNIDSFKLLKCTGTVVDHEENGVEVKNDQSCQEIGAELPATRYSNNIEPAVQEILTSSEAPFEKGPVKLDNEVQSNTAITSGEEQFVAIPRVQPSAPCIGCASQVNPEAPGVHELAVLGVKQLDRHEPNMRHNLNNVLEVVRQIQVVNGVRYILTIMVDYNNCTGVETEICAGTKPCKISVLEKPWRKLPDGSKYRAIISNNCTQEWLFGDDGELIYDKPDNKESNDIVINPNNDQDKTNESSDKNVDTIKVVHNVDVQALPNQEKKLTDEEIKVLEQQVIPLDQFFLTSTDSNVAVSEKIDTSAVSEHNIIKDETAKQHSDNSASNKPLDKTENVSTLTDDKKKAIDDLMNFFTFAGFRTEADGDHDTTRTKRSYDYDLEVMKVENNFYKLKKSLGNAKYVYKLAQRMVDYLNEMDMEIKTRSLKDVIAAEEEFKNHQHFFYIQVRVTIPCEKMECNNRDSTVKICNGVIDSTNDRNPKILNIFCYNDYKKKPNLDKSIDVELDDPVLGMLVKHAVKKIETESTVPNAMKLQEILNTNTQKVSGTLTKISVLLMYTNCSKEVHVTRRESCTVLEHLGKNICDISIDEKHWLKERKILYSCTQRPMGLSFSTSTENKHKNNFNDLKVLEMVQEVLLTMEKQSNRNSRQKVVEIKSVSTKFVGGLLINLELITGYTTCTTDFEVNINTCKLLENEPLRICQAQVWDRPWLEDGRRINVTCDDDVNNVENNKIQTSRKKRSSNLYLEGGEQEQNPNDAVYKELAEESLNKYHLTSGSKQYYKVIQIVKVTTQVVAGKLTRLDFKVSPTKCQLDEIGQPSSPNCEVEIGDTILCHSEVWERPGLNKKEITVNCNIIDQKTRQKRQAGAPGAPGERNPSDPHYKELAEDSLRQYVQSSGTTQHHKVVEVEKVSVQSVAGTLTKIDFKVSPTNCQLDSNGQPISSNCEVQSGDTILCHSEVWERPWLNKKEITVNCDISDQKTRKKRQAGAPGAPAEKNPNDPHYKELAEESLQQYVQSSGTTQHHKVVEVEKVSVQVVSGTLTKIDFKVSPTNNCEVVREDNIRCHSEVWERLWLNKKEITVNCAFDNKVDERERNVIIGGSLEQDPKNEKFKILAEQSMRKYLLNTGNNRMHEVVHIDRVTTQIVSGVKTNIYFKISPTNCQIDNTEVSHKCKIEENKIIDCHSEVWERPWLNDNNRLIEVTCGNINEKYPQRIENSIGGEEEQDPLNPTYTVLAEESLTKFQMYSKNQTAHKIVHIDRVTVQIIGGFLTKIDYTISPTNCTVKYSIENCEIKDSNIIKKCYSEIWDRPWLASSRQIEVVCEDPNNNDVTHNFALHGRGKRALVGGPQEQNPSKLEYKLLAEDSLRKYQQLQKNKINYKVMEVIRVVTQVVSGVKYDIDYIAIKCPQNVMDLSLCKQKENNKMLYCHTEIWNRPWIRRKEIDVSCNDDDSDERDEDYLKVKMKRSIPLGAPEEKNINKEQYRVLAQQALQKYQTLSKTKYRHKLLKIHHVVDQVVEGSLTTIEFSISPTKCLLDEAFENCKLQNPKTVLRCHAEIWDRPWLDLKDIDVNCKKQNKLKGKRYIDEERRKREAVSRPDDDYIEKDMRFYYADRAIQHINDNAHTHNLQKLMTIHDVQSSTHMGAPVLRMYIETAYTYCLRHEDELDLYNCDELEGLNHRLCLARLWPSPDDELVVQQVAVVCDDEKDFPSITGISIPNLINASISRIEKSPLIKNKLIHQGEPSIVPSLDSNIPLKLSFIVASLNCTKNVDLDKNRHRCFVESTKPPRSCQSLVWLIPNSKTIQDIKVKCRSQKIRTKRSVSLNSTNAFNDEITIQQLVQLSLEKLEMSSIHRYKQRVLQINSYSSKITTGKVTTIDFDVGYTSCLKYEWVDNITSCEFLEHLPRRHCVSNIWERLWLENGRNIEVTCEDDETPLEAHIEFENAETARQLAEEALKHIEAKYPHPRKLKLVRIFSLEKQIVAGVHYRMKIEVGLTDCAALSTENNCQLVNDIGLNRFCRVNVWLKPWTDHPPSFRVSCDYMEGASNDIYHHLQAEHLFRDFLTTYKPDYMNDQAQMVKRFEVFKDNVRKIHELNIHERGTAKYAVTRFADLTYEEFSSKYLGLKPSLRDPNQIPMRKAEIPSVKIPEQFDWREYKAVTDVKDQGSCGSCWAFSVTGNIEGQWKLHTGQLVSLSEQELVDCDRLDQGCNGGLPDNAYRAIEQLGGLEYENDYPYEGEDDKCAFNKTLSKVQISGAVNISSNETDMAKWLIKNGPISIGINANAMQFYVGGVSHPWKMLCNPSNLDHGVLIVGYGIKNYPLFHKRLPYWIVKNSWGKYWGEQGYYRVYRGDGTCGLNQMASSALV